jgi:hypothetical protein
MLSRSSIPFYDLDEVLHAVPALHRRSAGTSGGMEDHLIILGVAVEARRTERLSSSSLAAVARLHDLPHGYASKPPSSLRRGFHGLGLRVTRCSAEPWYPWISRSFDDDMYASGCLRVGNTRRFLRFVERAWLENWPLPDIERLYEDDWRGRGLCVSRERDPKLPDTPARFREFHLARELYSVVRRAGNFDRPLVYWYWC